MITGNIDPTMLKTVMVPKRPGNHMRVQHHTFLAQLLREVNGIRDVRGRHYKSGKIKVGLTPDSLDAVMAVEVIPSDFRLQEGQRLWLCASHSNSGRRGTHLYGCIEEDGAGVTCEKYTVVKKRGMHFDGGIEYVLAEQIDNFVVQCGNFGNRIRELRLKYISRPDADILMIRACRSGILQWSVLGFVENERRRVETGDDDRNAWSLYSAFSRTVLAKTNPITHNPLTDQLNRLFLLRQMLLEYAV